MRRNSGISAATTEKALTNIAVHEGAASSSWRTAITSRNATWRATETLPASETAHRKSVTMQRAMDSRMWRPIGGELTLPTVYRIYPATTHSIGYLSGQHMHIRGRRADVMIW